jgi:hypothetical protein
MTGEQTQQTGKEQIACPPEQRHLASGIQPASKHDVGMFVQQGSGEFCEKPGIAGAVGIQKGEKVGIRLLPCLLNRRAVTSIVFEDDELNIASVTAGQFDCPIRGAVADDCDGDFGYQRVADNLVPRAEATPDYVFDARFFVQSRNSDE